MKVKEIEKSRIFFLTSFFLAHNLLVPKNEQTVRAL